MSAPDHTPLSRTFLPHRASYEFLLTEADTELLVTERYLSRGNSWLSEQMGGDFGI